MKNKENTEIFESLICVNRVSKTVKGGRKLSFSALVVVGDKNGKIGFGHGKATEVSDAIRKASIHGKDNLVYVKLSNEKSVVHDVSAKSGASKIFIKKAKAGTGVICSSSIRPVFQLLGIEDVVAKSLGSNNPHNLIRACLKALTSFCPTI